MHMILLPGVLTWIYENITYCHGMTSMASMAEGKCHSSSSGSKASTYVTSQMQHSLERLSSRYVIGWLGKTVYIFTKGRYVVLGIKLRQISFRQAREFESWE